MTESEGATAVGPFTAAVARAGGFSDAEIRRRLRNGVWVVLRRGVYVAASVADAVAGDAGRRHALDAAGLLLAVGFDAIVGGRSAATIWSLPKGGQF